MSIQGALAASLRRFDPYPQAHLSLAFRGERQTAFRPFYKRGDVVAPRFESLPGAVSVGHAGFGRAQVNGAWRGLAANEPLIGDEGIAGADGRQNANPQSGELTIENGWALSSGSPPARTSGHLIEGLRATRFTTPIDVMAYRVYDETNAAWIAPVEGNNTATPYGAGPVSISVIAPAGCAALRIYPLRSQDNQTWTYKTFAVSPGQTYTARWIAAKDGNDYYIGCFEFLAGADVGGPPIQTDALPATRTATDYRVAGLEVSATHYGVARAKFACPVANMESAFPTIFEMRPLSAPSDHRVLWRAAKGDNGHALVFRTDNVQRAFFGLGAIIPGQWYTVAWRCKPGAWGCSFQGQPTQVQADPSAILPFQNLGILGNSLNSGNVGNGTVSDLHIWNGEISDAGLQALGARFANG